MTKASKKVLLIAAGIIVTLLIFFAWMVWKTPRTPPRTPEQVMGDTLRVEVKPKAPHEQTFTEYFDSIHYGRPGIDSSFTDADGNKWRKHNGLTVATLPKGFPFWVIWDKRGYALSKWKDSPTRVERRGGE